LKIGGRVVCWCASERFGIIPGTRKNREIGMKYLVCFLALLVVASGIAAQPYKTDVMIANIGSGTAGLFGDVLRLDPVGVITTALVLTSLSPFFPNMVVMDNDNMDLVVLETNTRSSPIQDRLTVYDLIQALPVQTLQGPTGSYMNWFDATGTGDFLVAGSTLVGILKRDGSGFTTVRSGAPFVSIHSCHYDISTGGYLIGDLNGNAVHRIAPDGTLVTTHTQTSLNPFAMTQDHRDGSIYIGSSGTVYAIDVLGTIKALPGSWGNTNAITFDRWSGDGEIVVGSKPVYRIDTTGTMITSHPGCPNIANAGMCFEQARNLVSIKKSGGPNRFEFRLHVPGQSGKGYVLAMSLLGFAPGLPIGNRSVPLVAGPIFFLTAQGLLPWLKNNIGALSTDRDPRKDARAVATLDLSGFGPIFRGLPAWIAAITIDGAAPNGVGIITKPIVIVLD